ncbi:MAG TPA: type II secretion system F family protein [Thiobacillaceae bacterium]|nr:type II secretion system F family protein [Thiobacillaceae bacterium]HNU64158.1 type II secretion system F family protein [Thiobacillaceae bacterium]
MIAFRYVGLTAQGQDVAGEIAAAGEAQAREALRAQGILAMTLAPAVDDAAPGLGLKLLFPAAWLPVRSSDRILFFKQMELMLRSRHTVLEALESAATMARKLALARALRRAHLGVQEGLSLSSALGREKRLFQPLAVRLLEAGEQSGELDGVFNRLAALEERAVEVKRQLINALIYPAIVLLMAIAVVSFLVLSVVPRFAVFLQGRGKGVPWAAQTMMDIADWLGRYGFWLALGLAGAVVGVLLLRTLPGTRVAADALLLRIPLVGGAASASAMARIAWTFGMLMKSRLTVLEAVRACAGITGNHALGHALDRAEGRILEGKSLAAALDQPVLPHLFRHMTAIGEKSGELEVVMESVGGYYQKELDARVKVLASSIEPLLTLVIGGIVGFVYYAFFQAIFAVSSGG